MARLGLLWRRGRRCRWRGRHGTWRHGPSLCVAGVALRDMDRHFAWQAWHLWHWAGSGGALGSPLAPWSPPPFAWQAWYLATCTVTLRGSRGTSRHGSSLCVAGVALIALGWLRWRALLLRTIAYTPFTHLPSTYICCTRRSFTISFLFPAFPIPSLPFFCCLLEEVDMWGYPVL